LVPFHTSSMPPKLPATSSTLPSLSTSPARSSVINHAQNQERIFEMITI
jgi:hypothetical protein